MKYSILIFSLLLFAFMPCYAQKKSGNKLVWTPELSLGEAKGIFSVEVSPNGEKTIIVYYQKENKYNKQFFVFSNKDKKVLFTSPAKDNLDEIKWSPDGKYISAIQAKGDRYIFKLTDTDKFNTITAFSFPKNFVVSDVKWAPNNKKIAFFGIAIGENENNLSHKFKGQDILIEPHKNKWPTRLAVLSIDLENKKFSDPFFLTPSEMLIIGDKNSINYSWSPDSLSLAFFYIQDGLKDPEERKLAIVNVETGKMNELGQKGIAFDPVFSPDGKTLAFLAEMPPAIHSPFKKPQTMITGTRVRLFDLEKGTQRWLATTPNEHPDMIGWSADGASVLVADNNHTTRVFYSLSTKDDTREQLPMGVIRNFDIPRLNSTSTHIGFIGENLSLPPEAYISSLNEFLPIKITDFNKKLQDFPKFKTEIITWSSFDGKIIEGILTYPEGYKKGIPIPLIVLAHGGPSSAWQQSYLGFIRGTPPSVAMLASHGFAVLRPNIRGSDGYGTVFRETIYKDWGPGPFKDIIAGVDHLIAQGIVDPDKLAIGGASYGGYITAFAITQTDRFKAAFVTSGVTDLISESTKAVGSLLPYYFGGEFWDNPKIWFTNSPIMHAEKIKTPTFILHGEQDKNVNISQGYELYNALKSRKIPVKMIVCKYEDHGFSGKAAIESTKATFDWLDKYLLQGTQAH